MTTAYDAAIAQLGIGRDSPLTSALAASIAELAAGGEGHSNALCDQAVAALRRAHPSLKR